MSVKFQVIVIKILDLDLENILADLDEEGFDLSNAKFKATMTFDKERFEL